MTPELQLAISVGVPTLAILMGILVNNSRLNDINVRMGEMRTHFDQRIDDLRDTLRAEMRRMEEVLDARLAHLEDRFR